MLFTVAIGTLLPLLFDFADVVLCLYQNCSDVFTLLFKQ
jgi:hypothetical protein